MRERERRKETQDSVRKTHKYDDENGENGSSATGNSSDKVRSTSNFAQEPARDGENAFFDV